MFVGEATVLYQLAHAEQVQAYSNEGMRPQRLGPLAVSLALTLLHVNGQSTSSSLVCNTKYLVPGTSATTQISRGAAFALQDARASQRSTVVYVH